MPRTLDEIQAEGLDLMRRLRKEDPRISAEVVEDRLMAWLERLPQDEMMLLAKRGVEHRVENRLLENITGMREAPDEK